MNPRRPGNESGYAFLIVMGMVLIMSYASTILQRLVNRSRL